MQKAYEAVPMQDFSKAWTDEMLYEKYGFTSDEISYIEATIKPTNVQHQEITALVQKTYAELVTHLLKKYGVAKHDYFKDTACTTKNPLVSRTSEGLYCHHIDEDKAIMLSNDAYAAANPFDYQKADRLVYCNLLEHLLLHIKIAAEPRNVDANENELPGIGGAVNFICRELNDIFGGKEPSDEWRKKVASLVKDSFDDYIMVLKYLLEVIEKNPIYKAAITTESLCVGYDGKVVRPVLNALLGNDD